MKLLIYNPKDRTGGPWGSFILQRNLTTQTANRKVPIISEEIILELRKTFLDDRKSLQDQIVETETLIRQNNDYIESLLPPCSIP